MRPNITSILMAHSCSSFIDHSSGVLDDADPALNQIYDFLICDTGCFALESVSMTEIKCYRNYFGLDWTYSCVDNKFQYKVEYKSYKSNMFKR